MAAKYISTFTSVKLRKSGFDKEKAIGRFKRLAKNAEIDLPTLIFTPL
jgi:hypothetical protein